MSFIFINECKLLSILITKRFHHDQNNEAIHMTLLHPLLMDVGVSNTTLLDLIQDLLLSSFLYSELNEPSALMRSFMKQNFHFKWRLLGQKQSDTCVH